MFAGSLPPELMNAPWFQGAEHGVPLAQMPPGRVVAEASPGMAPPSRKEQELRELQAEIQEMRSRLTHMRRKNEQENAMMPRPFSGDSGGLMGAMPNMPGGMPPGLMGGGGGEFPPHLPPMRPPMRQPPTQIPGGPGVNTSALQAAQFFGNQPGAQGGPAPQLNGMPFGMPMRLPQTPPPGQAPQQPQGQGQGMNPAMLDAIIMGLLGNGMGRDTFNLRTGAGMPQENALRIGINEGRHQFGQR